MRATSSSAFFSAIFIAAFFVMTAMLCTHGIAATELPEATASYPPIPIPDKGDIFAIFAHADDELPVLALLARYRQENPSRKIVWMIVNDNSGAIGSRVDLQGMSISEYRKKEAEHVANIMGIEPPVILGVKYKDIQNAHLENLIPQKIKELQSEGPAVIITHDERGLYGHPYHRILHKLLRKYAAKEGITLLAPALPRSWAHLWRFHFPRVQVPHHFPDVMYRLDLSPELQAKMIAATSAYDSQRRTVRKYFTLDLAPEEFYSAYPYEFFTLYR